MNYDDFQTANDIVSGKTNSTQNEKALSGLVVDIINALDVMRKTDEIPHTLENTLFCDTKTKGELHEIDESTMDEIFGK